MCRSCLDIVYSCDICLRAAPFPPSLPFVFLPSFLFSPLCYTCFLHFPFSLFRHPFPVYHPSEFLPSRGPHSLRPSPKNMQPLIRPTTGGMHLITSALRNRNRMDRNTRTLLPWIGKDIYPSIHLHRGSDIHTTSIYPSVNQCIESLLYVLSLSILMIMSNVDSFYDTQHSVHPSPSIHLMSRPFHSLSIHSANHIPFRPHATILVMIVSRQSTRWIVTSFPRHKLRRFTLAIKVIVSPRFVFLFAAIQFCFSFCPCCFVFPTSYS